MKLVGIVTGASSGIGAAVAHELAKHGYAVVLAARSEEPLRRVSQEIRLQLSGEALVVPTDVTRHEQVAALVQQTLDRYGRIDALVNSAGAAPVHSTASPTDEQIDLVLNTNLRAPILLTRAVLPTMKQQGSGHIVNIGSVAGHIGLPVSGLYVTSKFGLRGYTEAVRRSLLHTGVHVSLITLGFVRTQMVDDLELTMLPVPGPEVVARAIVKVLRRPRREVVVPGWYLLLIWLHAWLPGPADWVLNRMTPLVATSQPCDS